MPPPPHELRDIAVFSSLLLLSFALQFSFDPLVGSDGYFHIAQAARLGQGMPWMPDSVFAEGWVDHQLLFHTLLWPFAKALPGVLAAKAGAATLCAVAIFALYRFGAARGFPAPLALALAPVATSWLVLLRLEMPRTQALSLALLVACIAAMDRSRPKLLAALCFAYAWTYHVALGVLPVALLYAGIVSWRERRRDAWWLPAAAAAGLAAGWTLHPHSPRTWRFLHQHVVLKVLNRTDLPVGLEWSDGSLGGLIWLGGGGLVALGFAAVLSARGRQRSSLSLVLCALAAGTTVLAIAGTKFLEYSVPLSFLALGSALADRGLSLAQRQRAAVAALLAVLLLASGGRVASAVTQTEPDPDRLAGAATFLGEAAEPGEAVFHFSWNDFPELVFHAPQFTYVVGLDPHFLALHDPDRWALYEALGGAYPGHRSEAVAGEFGARWAVVALPHPGAREALGADPGFRLVFEDAYALVYAVRPLSSPDR